MPANRKVDPLQLQTMLKSGKSMSAIARELGVNKGTISKNAASLKLSSSGDLTLGSIKAVSRKLPALERLDRISKIIEDELGYIQTAIQETEGPERRAWEKIQIEHSAEIRKQLSLLQEIAITLYNVEQVEAFRKTVLEVIGETNEQIRDEILRRLAERRHASNAFGSGEFGI